MHADLLSSVPGITNKVITILFLELAFLHIHTPLQLAQIRSYDKFNLTLTFGIDSPSGPNKLLQVNLRLTMFELTLTFG